MVIDLKRVKLADLDSQCVIDVTKLVRIARVQEGVQLKLTDNKVVEAAFRFGLESDDLKTRMKFLQLRRSLKNCMNKNGMSNIDLPKYA